MKYLYYLIVLLICAVGYCKAEEKNGDEIVVVLVGDSTVTDKNGWGKAFAARFNDKVKVVNLSKAGHSSKSWLRYLPKALKAKPDFVLIQFGHNDMKPEEKRHTEPDGEFRDNMRNYIREFREIGAAPIIVSSVTRRNFSQGKIVSKLGPYAEASKAVAKEEHVPFIDLYTISVDYHNKIGEEASSEFGSKEKENDRTHFNSKSAEIIAEMILVELKKQCENLARYVKNDENSKTE